MTCRVLHVISGLNLHSGGPAVALAGLAIGQKRAGLTVSVVASYRAGREPQLDAELRREGVDVACVGPCHGHLARAPDLPAAVAAGVEAADIVHIHSLFEEVQYLAATCARARGKPYVIRPCGMLSTWSLRRSWLKKRLYMTWRLSSMLRSAAALHYTTHFEHRAAGRLALRPPTIVEPNGVDLSDYVTLPTRGAFRARFDIPPTAPLVTFLGRVHPGKGVEHLVRALGSGGVPNATLAVVGPDSGGHLAAMQSLATRIGVADRVVFTGLLSGQERIAALVDADVFSLPSDHENFGIAVAEAMAAGAPVIVSPDVGLADDVMAAAAGSVVGSEPGTLAPELARWLGDPTMCRAAGKRGRAFAMQHYDWYDIGRRWSGHYASLLGRPLAT